jgi:hypothetical protein
MSDRPRLCTAGLLFAAAVALLAGAPSAGANEVCGAIPTELDEQAARDAFGAADAAGFIESRAPLEAALDGVCDGNGDSARLFKSRASRVVFQIAAGATEPLPYLDGGALIVEFYGGAFDAAQFRREVEDTLRGESSEFND